MKSFGAYLKELRLNRNIGFDSFRTQLNISKAYLNDIETGHIKPPPREVQCEMVLILDKEKKLSSSEVTQIYDLAAKERRELPADVMKILENNPKLISDIRKQLK